jgi:hypothetical protein
MDTSSEERGEDAKAGTNALRVVQRVNFLLNSLLLLSVGRVLEANELGICGLEFGELPDGFVGGTMELILARPEGGKV